MKKKPEYRVIIKSGRRENSSSWYGMTGTLTSWNREDGTCSVFLPNPGGKSRKEPDNWRLRLPDACVQNIQETGYLRNLGHAIDIIAFLKSFTEGMRSKKKK